MSRGDQPTYPVPVPKELVSPATAASIIKRCSGITLREHYAGLAMQGLLANPNRKPYDASRKAEQIFADVIAYDALHHADALLAELAKAQP